MNPPPTDVVEPGDEILVIRPTTYRTGTYKPAPHMKRVDAGESSWAHIAVHGMIMSSSLCCLL